MEDEVLNILDDVMENGDSIPSKVSNRLLLAAIRKNYRISRDNADAIANNLKEVREKIVPRLTELESHTERHCTDLKKLTDHRARGNKFFYFVIFWIMAATVVIGWHTGVDLGWLPPLLPLIP